MRTAWHFAAWTFLSLTFVCCSATHDPDEFAAGSTGVGASSGTSGSENCGSCIGQTYTPCVNGKPGSPVVCTTPACAPGVGCVECLPNVPGCVGNEVHMC